MPSSSLLATKDIDKTINTPRFVVIVAIIFVCFTILISTFTLYNNALSRQTDLQDRMLQVEINRVQRSVEANLQREAYFIVWLANSFQRKEDLSQISWSALTENIKNTLPSLVGIYAMDKDKKIQWTEPSNFKFNNKSTINKKTDPILVFNSMPELANLTSSDIVKQNDGRLVIDMQHPVYIQGNIEGYIGAQYYIDQMINAISNEFLRPDQNLVLSNGAIPFLGEFPETNNMLSITMDLSSIKGQWQITLWQPSELENTYFSLPMLIFVAGILVTILVAIALYLLEVNIIGRHVESQSVSKLKEEIIQRKDAQSQLHFIANHDPQTHLPNRFAMESYLERTIHTESNIVLFCITLDTLREINDMYGHIVADQLLFESAKRFKIVLPSNAILARVDRDQFMVACAGMSQLEAEMQANQLRMCLDDEFLIEENDILTHCSIGIAYRYNQKIDACDMLRHADTAAHKAKAIGTRKVVAYNQTMQEQLTRQKELERSIRKAINNDELQLHFQPQVDLRTRQIVGVEALIRWEDANGTIIRPDVIIKTAEQTGLMQRLGHWVVDSALKTFSHMLDERCAPKCMAINVSGHEFQDGYLADYILRAVTRYDIPPSRVQIELTEQVFIENLEHNQHILNRLITSGIHLAIDDFGTGYSSLAYLKHFPVNTLKIDRGFVKDLPQSKDDLVICQAVVGMANLLQLKVVAEGIETLEQQELLRNIGCHFAQGHFYYLPMTAEKLMTILKQQQANRLYPIN